MSSSFGAAADWTGRGEIFFMLYLAAIICSPSPADSWTNLEPTLSRSSTPLTATSKSPTRTGSPTCEIDTRGAEAGVREQLTTRSAPRHNAKAREIRTMSSPRLRGAEPATHAMTRSSRACRPLRAPSRAPGIHDEPISCLPRPWQCKRGRRVYQFRTELLDSLAEGRFETAVYRFLELHAGDQSDVLIAIHTDVRDAGFVKSVTLWSDEAVGQFGRF